MSIVTTGYGRSNKHENINNSARIWNRRISHASNPVVEHMIRRRYYGIRVEDKVNNETCETAILTKQCRAPFNGSLVKNSHNVIVHIDIQGRISVRTHGVKSHLLMSPETPQRYTEVELLSHHNEGTEYCRNYIAWLERSYKWAVKRAHSDNAKETLSMSDRLYKHGIDPTITPTYGPESSGLTDVKF